MTTQRITVAGITATSLTLHVPHVGVWWADAVLEDETSVSGRVELVIGEDVTLSGTVATDASGAFGLQRSVRIIGGADGWRKLIARQGYHNDGGVRSRLVATDAATACGEVIDSLAPSSETVGVDFVREAGPASAALVAAIGDVPWWVGYDGRTRVGARVGQTLILGTFELREFDPIGRVAIIGTDDLGRISIGSIIPADERISETLTIRELRIEVTSDEASVYAWCGESTTFTRAARALERIIDHILDRRLLTPRRYRVIRMNGDRVELQGVSVGAPDIGPISMSPGVAGAHAGLTPGALVLVTFPDGDRSRPLITHFEGKDGNGWSPVTLTFDATDKIKLGKNATLDAARKTDAVQVVIPAGTVVVSVSGGGGSPAVGTMNPTDITLEGQITEGSNLVAIGQLAGGFGH
jgi:hypothetical protein